jgi:hypothetical protein
VVQADVAAADIVMGTPKATGVLPETSKTLNSAELGLVIYKRPKILSRDMKFAPAAAVCDESITKSDAVLIT